MTSRRIKQEKQHADRVRDLEKQCDELRERLKRVEKKNGVKYDGYEINLGETIIWGPAL